MSTARGEAHAYIKVTARDLKGMNLPSAACAVVCDKYLKISARQSKTLLGGVAWSALVERTSGSLAALAQLPYVRTVTVDRQSAWELSADGATAYIAAHGRPYLLRLMTGSDRIDYTKWNSVTIPPPPPASQIADLSQLAHP